jgi:hypothetical protein
VAQLPPNVDATAFRDATEKLRKIVGAEWIVADADLKSYWDHHSPVAEDSRAGRLSRLGRGDPEDPRRRERAPPAALDDRHRQELRLRRSVAASRGIRRPRPEAHEPHSRSRSFAR